MTTTDTAAAAIEAAYQLLGFIFDADDLIEFRTLGKVVGSTWAKQQQLKLMEATLDRAEAA
jgi:hypothetical protein